jgi:hypothetical protein
MGSTEEVIGGRWILPGQRTQTHNQRRTPKRIWEQYSICNNSDVLLATLYVFVWENYYVRVSRPRRSFSRIGTILGLRNGGAVNRAMDRIKK